MSKKSILFLLFSLSLVFQGCDSKKEQNSNEQTKQANSMVSKNEFTLTTLKNEKLIVTKETQGFKLSQFDGKVVIFDIFATWCPPCRAAATHLSSLQEKYKDDLVVIGISIEDNIPNEKLQDFKEQYNANYTLVNSAQNRKLANAIVGELKLGERFPIPIMALYKDGKYINHYIGAVQEEFIESDIKKALGK